MKKRRAITKKKEVKRTATVKGLPKEKSAIKLPNGFVVDQEKLISNNNLDSVFVLGLSLILVAGMVAYVLLLA